MRLASSVGVYQYTIGIDISNDIKVVELIMNRLTEEGHHARPSTAFEQAKEYSKDVDLVRILGESNKSSDKTPSYLQAG